RNVFAPLAQTPEAWTERGIEARYFEPVGRDEPLEARLLRRIVERSLRVTGRDAGVARAR
ncbi:hypothetical protein, partial [Tritonibacter sp. SIMBA_163]|uniref:hypothetical protein n=1 Tax=Tritonibacter sp. SIMBA_163 TaxID=3080868 RepID=UPI00397F94AE